MLSSQVEILCLGEEKKEKGGVPEKDGGVEGRYDEGRVRGHGGQRDCRVNRWDSGRAHLRREGRLALLL